jgi:hypothetical protein
MLLSISVTYTRFSTNGVPRNRSRTDSNFFLRSSGMPGRMYTFSTTTNGNQRSPLSISVAPAGMRAILSWLGLGSLPFARRMRSSMLAEISRGRPNAAAIPSMVRSSWVGPIPPDVNT